MQLYLKWIAYRKPFSSHKVADDQQLTTLRRVRPSSREQSSGVPSGFADRHRATLFTIAEIMAMEFEVVPISSNASAHLS